MTGRDKESSISCSHFHVYGEIYAYFIQFFNICEHHDIESISQGVADCFDAIHYQYDENTICMMLDYEELDQFIVNHIASECFGLTYSN